MARCSSGRSVELAAIWGNRFIEHRLKVDDAIGAIGVHGVAGVVGTIGLALFAPVANLPLGNRFDQLVIQGTGVAINFVWAFGLGYVLSRLYNRFFGLRVSAEAERRGLNDAEHGSRLGVGHVEEAMASLVGGRADLSKRLPVEPGDEAEILTTHFNALMDRVEADERARALQTDAQRSAEEAERLTALSNAAFESIIVVVGGRIVDGNQATSSMLSVPIEELKGQRLETLMPYEDWPAITNTFTSEQSEPFETTVSHRRGNQVPVEVRGRQIVFRGTETLVLALRDMRERRHAEARIRHLAMHDPLTDLPNRTVFQERLANALDVNGRTGIGVALFLVDLDHFKDVNDIHGHPVGDKVIMAAAQRLSESVRATDTVARLGGDEFAVIQTGFSFSNQVTDLAGRIVKALAAPISLGDGMQIRCGASVGVAICSHGGGDVEQIISQADAALYRSKGNGRSTFRIFEPGMDAAIRKRQSLQADLADAVEKASFALHFQPQADVPSGEIRGYEALLRWQHPDKGMISPADFIPIAEETGLILPLGRWVIHEACKVAKHWTGSERVAVNVSPIQFRDRNFVGIVIDALEESGLEPHRLELEVTESVLIDDDHRALTMLRQLKALGASLALDDFGTGYASLSYLRRFPFDRVKIDRSFIQDAVTSEGSLAIIRAIVDLAKSLDMKIIAEGVETEAQMALVREEECDEVQGFLIGRPEPWTDPTPLRAQKERDRLVSLLRDAAGELRAADGMADNAVARARKEA